MKVLKNILLAVLSAALLLSTQITALAEDLTGSITITNALKGEDYRIYRILELESYNAESGTYAYKADPKWNTFLQTDGVKGTYVSFVDEYVTWVDGANAAAFAGKAISYAAANSIPADKTVTAEGPTVTLNNLPLGYYLLDSSVGTLCSLDTTDPNAVIREKNSIPTITKEVLEAKDNTWGEENCASIGDTVSFRSSVTIGDGAVSYRVHDQMEAGLTFNKDSVTITQGNGTLSAANYTVYTENLADGCTFEIVFSDVYLNSLTHGSSLVISYTAVLNQNAEIADESNDNTTWLSYGEKQTVTEKDKTKTFTYAFDLVKTDKAGNVLYGAKFSLYAQENGGDAIRLVKIDTNTYRLAEATKTENVVTEIDAGHPTIRGLGSGTFYLEETLAPDGYNKLTERVAVVVDEANNYGTIGADQLYKEGGVQVINNSGIRLPSTGGTGTTVFYICGLALAGGAALLLVRNKAGKKHEE